LKRAPGFACALLCALSGCELVIGVDETHEWQDANGGGDTGALFAGAPNAGGSSPGKGRAGSDASSAGDNGAGGVGDAPSSGGPAAGVGPRNDGGNASNVGSGEVHAGGDGGADAGSGGEPSGGSRSACSADGDPVGIEDRIPRVQKPWPQRDIPVCYQRPSEQRPAQDGFFSHVAVLFQQNWQRFANINGVGWEACQEATEGMAVVVTDSEPSFAEVGYPGSPGVRVVTLNLHASDAEVLYWFGRALGMDHEYGRSCVAGRCVACSGAAGCPEERPDCLPSGFCGRSSDHESILAPPDCGGIESIRRLSFWDIAGLQRAYGYKPAGAWVNSSGTCAQVDTPHEWAGDEVVSAPCRNEVTQAWHFSFGTPGVDSDLLAYWYGNEERCLSMDEPAFERPTQAFTALCDWSSTFQNFHMDAMWLRGMGGLCIVTSPGVDDTLSLQRCGTLGPADRWEVRAGRFHLVNTNLCATVTGSSPAVGAALSLNACAFASDPRQDFVLEAGRIRSGALCWSFSGGLTLGASIVLSDACEAAPAHFFVTGPVHAPYDDDWEQNLSLRDGVVCAETPEPGSPEQEWDFHW
jgi:hypothetical protein